MSPGVLTTSELAALERLAVVPDRRVPGSGSGPHRSRSRGRSLDVVDWREYQPGDDPRSIDVQAWARLDHVLVRLYEADVDLRVQIVVDTSASMGFGGRLTQAARIAAALGVTALVRNETVSVCTLGDATLRRFRGRGTVPTYLDMIATWRAEGPTPLADVARTLGATTRRSGVVVVVSDFLAPTALESIDLFAMRREQVVAVQVVSAAEEHPDALGEVQLVDAETGDRVDVDMSPEVVEAFAARRAAARRELEARMLRHGGRSVVVDSASDLISSVVPTLIGRGVLR